MAYFVVRAIKCTDYMVHSFCMRRLQNAVGDPFSAMDPQCKMGFLRRVSKGLSRAM